MHSFTSVLLVVKARHKKAAETAAHMVTWLGLRGIAATVQNAGGRGDVLVEAALGVQAVIVLGGDGTFVGVARKLADLRLPLLGINFGQVGFLAEVPASHWEQALEGLVNGTMPVSPRVMLAWSIVRQGRVLYRGHAVNDIVVGRGSLARVLSVQVSVDGEPMGWVRADGMIVATPLGTSGYVLSAGGSLIQPGMQAVSITAISPFLNSFPSMVLPAGCVISLEVDPAVVEAFLTVDGQDGLPLASGDVVLVHSEGDALQLLVPDNRAYFRRLRDCGFVQEYQPVRQRATRRRENGVALANAALSANPARTTDADGASPEGTEQP